MPFPTHVIVTLDKEGSFSAPPKEFREKMIPLRCNFFQTLSVFSNPLDLFDQSLLLDMLFLGAPQLRTGLGFLFFFKVSFMKHPSDHL